MVRLGPLLVALLGIAVVVSLIEGVPERLPGVALGSEVLLHVERAGAVFAIVVAILSVLAQAARGRLPTQLSTAGLAYEPDAAAVAANAVDSLQGQVERMEADIDDLKALLLGDEASRG